MLNKTQIDLIETIKNKQLVTSTYLSDCLICSKRSIINYVKEINAEYPGLIRSTKKGYYLDQEIFDQIAVEYRLNQQFSSDYRIKEIVRSFFISGNDTVNINHLCNELYVSESTVRSDIYSIKRSEIEKVSVSMNKSCARLQGKEKEIRSFYFSYLYRSIKTDFFKDDISRFFPYIDIERIRKIVKDGIRETGLAVNGPSFFSLFLQIVLFTARIRTGHLLNEEEVSVPKFVRKADLDCANNITEMIAKETGCLFPQTEIDNISVLLATFNTNFNISNITIDNLQEYLWPSLYKLYIEIVEALKNRYKIDIMKNPSNAVGLALHLRSLIHRGSVNMFADNPLSASIKNIYPISYECSIYMARKIYDSFQVMITEDEITFLAVYVANNMRIFRSSKGKIDVLFIIPEYNIISGELFNYYSNHFSSDIRSSLINDKKASITDHFDLIVTADGPVLSGNSTPVISIHPFINSEDEDLLNETIKKYKKAKRRNYIRMSLSSVMDPSRFFLEQDLQDINSILDKMIAALYSSGITSEKLKEDVLIRSMISNVTVNSIALLRPCLNASGNNSFSFMRLAEPIIQGNERVEAVILLTFCETKFLDYLNVMEYLFNFIQDKEKARKILAVSDFDSLKELLVGRSEP